jgi:hypothetical protein
MGGPISLGLSWVGRESLLAGPFVVVFCAVHVDFGHGPRHRGDLR